MSESEQAALLRQMLIDDLQNGGPLPPLTSPLIKPPPESRTAKYEHSISDKAVQAAAKAMTDEGAAPGNSIHGWRCEYPDRYGPCDCVNEVARAALAAALPHLLTELRMTEGDLAVASRVATERADEIAELRAEADRLDRVLDGLVDHKLQLDEMRAFAAWLIAMDDPEDVIGREDRRRVTLTQIIERARFALGLGSDDKGDPDAAAE